MKEFWLSLIYFIELYRGGFRIHRTPKVTQWTFYNLYWGENVISGMTTIALYTRYWSKVDHWSTLANGHLEPLLRGTQLNGRTG